MSVIIWIVEERVSGRRWQPIQDGMVSCDKRSAEALKLRDHMTAFGLCEYRVRAYEPVKTKKAKRKAGR